jgi:hypothetical protein
MTMQPLGTQARGGFTGAGVPYMRRTRNRDQRREAGEQITLALPREPHPYQAALAPNTWHEDPRAPLGRPVVGPAGAGSG